MVNFLWTKPWTIYPICIVHNQRIRNGVPSIREIFAREAIRRKSQLFLTYLVNVRYAHRKFICIAIGMPRLASHELLLPRGAAGTFGDWLANDHFRHLISIQTTNSQTRNSIIKAHS